MADTPGMADLWGLDIDKIAKGYADEAFIFKQFCSVTPTSKSEVRWFQKSSGTLDAEPPQQIETAAGATPTYLEQSWTRNTSYVIPYAVESFIAYMDQKDI